RPAALVGSAALIRLPLQSWGVRLASRVLETLWKSPLFAARRRPPGGVRRRAPISRHPTHSFAHGVSTPRRRRRDGRPRLAPSQSADKTWNVASGEKSSQIIDILRKPAISLRFINQNIASRILDFAKMACA